MPMSDSELTQVISSLLDEPFYRHACASSFLDFQENFASLLFHSSVGQRLQFSLQFDISLFYILFSEYLMQHMSIKIWFS